MPSSEHLVQLGNSGLPREKVLQCVWSTLWNISNIVHMSKDNGETLEVIAKACPIDQYQWDQSLAFNMPNRVN